MKPASVVPGDDCLGPIRRHRIAVRSWRIRHVP